MRRSQWFRTSSSGCVLKQIIHAVADNKVNLASDDVFRLAALAQPNDDRLELAKEKQFMLALVRARDRIGSETFAPFQRSQMDKAFEYCNVDSSMVSTSSVPAVAASSEGNGVVPSNGTAVAPSSGQDVSTAEDDLAMRIKALQEIMQQFKESKMRSYDAPRASRHCAALQENMRSLNGPQVCQVAFCLSQINYQDNNFATLLARRGCEVASTGIQPNECAALYLNLAKLNVQDSMHPLLLVIKNNMSKLRLANVGYFILGVERHHNTASNTGPILQLAVAELAKRIGEISDTNLLRAAMLSLARYRLANLPAVKTIANRIVELIDEFPERNLLPTLSSMAELGCITEKTFPPIHRKLCAMAPTMEVRGIETLLDIISLQPFDSTAFMDACLTRLTVDCGHLTPHQFAFILSLIASYPPAKGHAAVKALSDPVLVGIRLMLQARARRRSLCG